MKKVSLLSLFFIFFAFLASVFAQTPIPKPSPPISNDEDVIRISSELVQTDFIVLDKDGKQVRDLKESDIEILQDGKPQKITNFSYVNSALSENLVEKQKQEKNSPPIPSSSLNPNQAGRLITFIIDDGNCNSSHLGISSATNALVRFINEQMQPNDRIAIYQTKGGSNLLEQYTSNKEQLLKRVKKIKYFLPVFGCGAGVFDVATRDETNKVLGTGRKTFETESDKKSREAGEGFNRNNQVVGTIGVLNFAIERLKPVAGRKTVFFLSDGFEIPLGSRALDAVRGIIDNASRSSVIFNTIDTRGLIAPGSTGEDDISRDFSAQMKKIDDTQRGLKYLADETGGSYYINQNRLAVGIKEILNDQSGYYLVGYQPNDETFKSKDFHKIEIKVKNPDFKVLSRAGFYGIEDKPQKTKQKTADSPLFQAIIAPIQESGIDSRLTTLYQNNAKVGNFIRALLYLNGQDLTLVDEPSGTKKLSVDVVAVTLDDKSKVVNEFNRTHTIHIPKEAIPIVLQNGFVYTVDVPIEKSGAYSFRIVVRDNTSNRLASASDFVEVQEIKKDKFFMSGLITAEYRQNGTVAFPVATSAEEAISPIISNTNSAVRQFRAGDSLFYSYTVYNPKIDNVTKKPNLTTQLRLYRDGNLIVEGKEKLIAMTTQADLTRIYDTGSLGITPGVQAGEYILQIVITDKVANKTTSQWIDFEVLE